ncbi:hypothetical protein THASP1DRAFT_31675 [Thamnocephalis sphaerospora]|uniref:Superoxide dismutase copper/zinc binding domain-containing protein n=1 Tax=Thamnocephalis sphaerospora TaxID=78915 RepID=A0A4P9XL51_9FUNG|nr:hypothetical protein THASP1DRAFT_31675 [Thamnocephalis sphaerospora]|eukprot:RKP06512.1 hypothetical protein THASP1DRAFT_31675 [Thamnocephalis sphaerospora]
MRVSDLRTSAPGGLSRPTFTLLLVMFMTAMALVSAVAGDRPAFLPAPTPLGPRPFPIRLGLRALSQAPYQPTSTATKTSSADTKPTNAVQPKQDSDAYPTAAQAEIKMNGVQAIIRFDLVNLTNWMAPPENQRVVGGYSPPANTSMKPPLLTSEVYGDLNVSLPNADGFKSHVNGKRLITGLRIQVDISSGLADRRDGAGYAMHVHGGNCSDIGTHLNPTKVDAIGCYDSGTEGDNVIRPNGPDATCPCRPGAPLESCEAGNLADKWGLLRALDNSTTNAAVPVVWYDPTLNMVGNNSVLGQSLVLHWPNRTMMACATINFVGSDGVVRDSGNDRTSSASTWRHLRATPLHFSWPTLLTVFMALATLAAAALMSQDI